MTHFNHLFTKMAEKFSSLLAYCQEDTTNPSGYYKNELCEYIPNNLNRHSEISRGFYGIVPPYHTLVTGMDPLNILAGLAFFAFLFQTIHSLVYRPPFQTQPATVPISRVDRDQVRALASSVNLVLENYDKQIDKQEMKMESSSSPSTAWSWISIVHMFQELLRKYWQARNAPPCYSNLVCQVVLHFRSLTKY